MLSRVVQKLNKSFGSNKTSSPEKSPTSSNQSDESIKKICSLCKGEGCCFLCERDDGWNNMVYCSNENENHIIHQACDNLTPQTLRYIDLYYCPKCRKDSDFQVTFFENVSQNKKREIRNLLNIPEPISIPKAGSKKSKVPSKKVGSKKSKVPPKKTKKNLEKIKKSDTSKTNKLLNLESESLLQIDTISILMESLLQQVVNKVDVGDVPPDVGDAPSDCNKHNDASPDRVMLPLMSVVPPLLKNTPLV